MDATAAVKCRLSLCESPQKRSMKLLWGLNLWRMAKLREFNQPCSWNAPGGLTPEFRVISELLGYLRRSAIGREGGPVELANHQRRRAVDTLELVHDRLSERHVEDARLHPTYNLSPRSSKHTSEHLDPAVVFRVPVAGVIDPLLIILDAVEIRLSLDNQLLIDLKIWRAAQRTEDAGAGILTLCALLCGFALFVFYLREQTNTAPIVFSSIPVPSAKSLPI
jgi:hypothetical protein